MNYYEMIYAKAHFAEPRPPMKTKWFGSKCKGLATSHLDNEDWMSDGYIYKNKFYPDIHLYTMNGW